MIEKREVEKLSGEWARAELEGDTAFLSERLAEDFIAIGPRGFVLTKEEWIERHESGKLTYGSFELEEVRLRIYGDAAVLTARQVADAVYQDGERRFEMHDGMRVTVVFANTGDATSIVGVQLSQMAGPPA